MPTIEVNHARARSGSVSGRNSKMPGSTFALTTSACKVGGKLAKVRGSTCHRCYAVSLEKFRSNLNTAWTRNLELATAAIAADPEAWAQDMALQIRAHARAKGSQPFHRWFDAGDLQSVDMLAAIVRVARLTPGIAHWLPTREAAMVRDYLARFGEFPSNLVVRVSSAMVDDRPMKHAHTSTVHKLFPAVGHVCPARTQGNQCGACRACWSADVANVSYPLH